MRASIALEPKSHCDSRTPVGGLAQSRVSVSFGNQSCADAESDQSTTPTSFWATYRARGGVRDPYFLAQIDSWLAQLDENIRTRIRNTISDRAYEIHTRV